MTDSSTLSALGLGLQASYVRRDAVTSAQNLYSRGAAFIPLCRLSRSNVCDMHVDAVARSQ